MRATWRDYLADFHADRPGITEELLDRTRDDHGRTPYGWAATAVPPGSVVLDLACGSAPMAEVLGGSRYVGVDLSAAELAVAERRRAPVVQADATALPLIEGAVDVVVVSMALMLVPMAPTLAEVRRVLRPGGRLVALLPSAGPLPPADRLRWTRLCWALRKTHLEYPNDEDLTRPLPGFDVVHDERVAFRCLVDSEDTARLLLHALYLPDVGPERMARGTAVVTRWVGKTVTTPLRLLVATARG